MELTRENLEARQRQDRVQDIRMGVDPETGEYLIEIHAESARGDMFRETWAAADSAIRGSALGVEKWKLKGVELLHDVEPRDGMFIPGEGTDAGSMLWRSTTPATDLGMVRWEIQQEPRRASAPQRAHLNPGRYEATRLGRSFLIEVEGDRIRYAPRETFEAWNGSQGWIRYGESEENWIDSLTTLRPATEPRGPFPLDPELRLSPGTYRGETNYGEILHIEVRRNENGNMQSRHALEGSRRGMFDNPEAGWIGYGPMRHRRLMELLAGTVEEV